MALKEKFVYNFASLNSVKISFTMVRFFMVRFSENVNRTPVLMKPAKKYRTTSCFTPESWKSQKCNWKCCRATWSTEETIKIRFTTVGQSNFGKNSRWNWLKWFRYQSWCRFLRGIAYVWYFECSCPKYNATTNESESICSWSVSWFSGRDFDKTTNGFECSCVRNCWWRR